MSFNIKKMRKFLLLLAGSTRLLTRVTQQGEQALIDNFFKVNACTNISLKRVIHRGDSTRVKKQPGVV